MMTDLIASIRVEQRAAWEAGQPLLIEHFVDQNPMIREDESALLDLICSEIMLRQDLKVPYDSAEYARRFPTFSEHLSRVIELVNLFEETTDDTPFPQSSTLLDSRRGIGFPSIPGIDIVRFIASGSWGSVYQGVQHSLNRSVAVKVLDRAPHNDTVAAYLRHEGTAQARLNHPNIAQVYDSGTHDSHSYIVMEYVEGMSLATRLAEKITLPPNQVATILASIAEAISIAHEAGVIHRDLKPANILLTTDSVPKIVDFGLARQIDSESITTPSTFAGSACYMAPELTGDHPALAGKSVDIFALGVILHEMLTGVPPFRGNGLLETLGRIARSPTPPWEHDSHSEGLDAIRRGCLEKDPSIRYAFAADVASDCRLFLAGLPIRHSVRNNFHRRKMLAVAASVVIPAIGFGAFALQRRSATVSGSTPENPLFEPLPTTELIRAGIAEKLKRGEPYEYNGKNKRLSPLLWRVGKPSPTSDDPENDITVSSLGTTCLELLDRHPCDQYQISVEMKILQMPFVDATRAGIYVSFSSPSAGCWAAIIAAYSEKGGSNRMGSAELGVQIVDQQNNFRVFCPLIGSIAFDVGEANREGPWRTIAISVQKESVSFLWNSTSDKDAWQRSEGVPLATFAECIKGISRGRKLMGYNAFPELKLGLGIFVHNCVVAIRRIRLEPLHDQIKEN